MALITPTEVVAGWTDLAEDPNWKYVITDQNANELGTVQQAHNRTYADPLNGMKSWGFNIAIDNPLADLMMDTDTICKVYRRNYFGVHQIVSVGDVIQAEEKGDGNASYIDVLAADPFWRLMKRLAGLDVDPITGQGKGITLGTPEAPVDIGAALLFAFQLLYTEATNTTGIAPGTAFASTASVIGPLYATFFGQMMQDACATLGGPDFSVDPLDPTPADNPLFGTLNFFTKRGFTRTSSFEYGTGQHNVQSYSRLRSKQNSANTIWALPQGWPDAIAKGDGLAIASDFFSIADIGQLDDIAGADVASMQLRQALCAEHVSVRGRAQQQFTFQPRIDCNLLFPMDFGTGDIIGARAYQDGNARIDGTVRLYGVALAIDDNEAETVTLTLIPETGTGV